MKEGRKEEMKGRGNEEWENIDNMNAEEIRVKLMNKWNI